MVEVQHDDTSSQVWKDKLEQIVTVSASIVDPSSSFIAATRPSAPASKFFIKAPYKIINIDSRVFLSGFSVCVWEKEREREEYLQEFDTILFVKFLISLGK